MVLKWIVLALLFISPAFTVTHCLKVTKKEIASRFAFIRAFYNNSSHPHSHISLTLWTPLPGGGGGCPNNPHYRRHSMHKSFNIWNALPHIATHSPASINSPPPPPIRFHSDLGPSIVNGWGWEQTAGVVGVLKEYLYNGVPRRLR